MSQPEPEWDDQDRAELDALAIIEADECSSCGGSLTETTSAEAASKTYVVHQSRCHRCTAVGEMADAYRSQPQPQALRFYVERD